MFDQLLSRIAAELRKNPDFDRRYVRQWLRALERIPGRENLIRYFEELLPPIQGKS